MLQEKNLKKNKIKKTENTSSIELVKTVDILQQLGEKKSNQLLVGFSLETENELANAKSKHPRASNNISFLAINHI